MDLFRSVRRTFSIEKLHKYIKKDLLSFTANVKKLKEMFYLNIFFSGHYGRSILKKMACVVMKTSFNSIQRVYRLYIRIHLQVVWRVFWIRKAYFFGNFLKVEF